MPCHVLRNYKKSRFQIFIIFCFNTIIFPNIEHEIDHFICKSVDTFPPEHSSIFKSLLHFSQLITPFPATLNINSEKEIFF